MASGGAGHPKQNTDNKPEVLDFEVAPPLARDDLIERMRGAAVIYAPCIDQGLSAGMGFLARITHGLDG